MWIHFLYWFLINFRHTLGRKFRPFLFCVYCKHKFCTKCNWPDFYASKLCNNSKWLFPFLFCVDLALLDIHNMCMFLALMNVSHKWSFRTWSTHWGLLGKCRPNKFGWQTDHYWGFGLLLEICSSPALNHYGRFQIVHPVVFVVHVFRQGEMQALSWITLDDVCYPSSNEETSGWTRQTRCVRSSPGGCKKLRWATALLVSLMKPPSWSYLIYQRHISSNYNVRWPEASFHRWNLYPQYQGLWTWTQLPYFYDKRKMSVF